jgi:hypothetical protein
MRKVRGVRRTNAAKIRRSTVEIDKSRIEEEGWRREIARWSFEFRGHFLA